MRNNLLIEIGITALVLLLVVMFASAHAGTLNFVWGYTAAQQKLATRFELVMDGGQTIVVNNISPADRSVSYDMAPDGYAHTFALRACNAANKCSQLSDFALVLPAQPKVPTGFKLAP